MAMFLGKQFLCNFPKNICEWCSFFLIFPDLPIFAFRKGFGKNRPYGGLKQAINNSKNRGDNVLMKLFLYKILNLKLRTFN